MIKLRPHHLLCINAFTGKGYSISFIKNMEKTIKQLIKDDIFKLVQTSDDICSECPHLLSDTTCDSSLKVDLMDKMVIKYLSLEIGINSYNQIKTTLRKKLQIKTIHDICDSCEWYDYGICINEIINKFSLEI